MKQLLILGLIGFFCLGFVTAQSREINSASVEIEAQAPKKMFWERWFDPKQEKTSKKNISNDADTKKSTFVSRIWNRIAGKKNTTDVVKENIISDTDTDLEGNQIPNQVFPSFMEQSLPSRPDLNQDNFASTAHVDDSNVLPSLTSDTDKDAIANALDLCPQTPGPINGCPDLDPYIPPRNAKNITLRRLNETTIGYEEFDQIRVGDVFELQIIDPITGTVIETSNSYLVEQ